MNEGRRREKKNDTARQQSKVEMESAEIQKLKN